MKVFLNEYSMDVNIISHSSMIKKQREEMIVDSEFVSQNIEVVDGLPVMGLILIREIKNFSRRGSPKTDVKDVRLIEELLKSNND